MVPMPTQIAGARFLAARKRAFLWDQCRVGKTGSAIVAADCILARTILVVTTASGRGVWRRAFPAWSMLGRRVRVLDSDPKGETDVGIVSWGGLRTISAATRKRPDLIILDEDHKACNPDAQRTQHVYGCSAGRDLLVAQAIIQPGDRVWHLSGTPMPHDLGNAWARMRASCPERLAAAPSRGWPDVTTYDDFRQRYCIIGRKRLPNNDYIPVMLGGRNEAELRARLDGIYLRRTQRDVGIRPPRYELLPLIVAPSDRAAVETPNGERILAAAREGRTDDLAKELGSLRRLTGMIKAGAAVAAAKDELEGGLNKLVLAYWHRDVGDVLAEGLKKFGVVRLDGATPPKDRENIEKEFAGSKRVFLAQIEAACEAIDLSASNEIWVVEYATSPRQMDQISKRITNVGAARTCFVRACCIEGSIDEALQAALLRLWAPIKEVVR